MHGGKLGSLPGRRQDPLPSPRAEPAQVQHRLVTSDRGSRRGFTILEVVVTLLLIGILSGMGAVLYSGVIANSKSSVAADSAATLGRNVLALAGADNRNPRLGTPSPLNPEGVLGGYVSEVGAEIATGTGTTIALYAGFADRGAAGRVEVTVNGTQACLELPSSPRKEFKVTSSSCASVTASVT